MFLRVTAHSAPPTALQMLRISRMLLKMCDTSTITAEMNYRVSLISTIGYFQLFAWSPQTRLLGTCYIQLCLGQRLSTENIQRICFLQIFDTVLKPNSKNCREYDFSSFISYASKMSFLVTKWHNIFSISLRKQQVNVPQEERKSWWEKNIFG